MTTDTPSGPAPDEPPMTGMPSARVLADWTLIWASEAAALAADREAQEAWHRTAQACEALLREARSPRPDAPPRAAPAAPAPDPGELADLRRRIEELERRLAERGG